MLNFVEVDILPVDYLAQSTQMAKSLCLRLEASLDFSGWIQKRLNYVRKHMFFFSPWKDLSAFESTLFAWTLQLTKKIGQIITVSGEI